MFNGDSRNAKEISDSETLETVGDEEQLRELVDKVVKENPQAVEKFFKMPKKAARTRKFFIGQVMSLTGGRANAVIVERLLDSSLEDAGASLSLKK